MNLCATRWVERHTAFIRFVEMIQAVILALDDMTDDMDTSSENRAKAATFAATMRQFSFIVNLLILEKVAALMKNVSLALQVGIFHLFLVNHWTFLFQNSQVDLVKCCSQVDGVIEVLETYVNEPEHFDSLFERAESNF